ncbi:hypothetical protein OsJ_00696 [Oryza sativa Japonica Group]|uniref:DUF1618 domain-containing protein n=1 Tax=Oryza sativa subsp. japonica TaxID=39947 RepID=B9ETK7_ORYSJ|nr:hypothetical protein OsJ_00696 [Oryza sativa Japonica Group]
MRIPTTETETGTGTRSHRRRKGSSDGSRAVHRTDASRRGPTPTKETEIPGRPPKRSSLTLSLDDAGASNPASTWAILNRYGARRDSFRGDDRDRTTSAVSYTSGGDQISVSFELVKPPETSLLTLDWPQGPRPSAGTTSYPYVIAAHDNVVLFQIISPDKYARPSAIDYFVYNANSSSSSNHHPSLTRLPVSYWRRRDTLRPRIMSREGTCILSCSNNSPSFVVAELERRSCQSSETNIYLFASGSDDWRVFRNVPIRHGDGLAHLCLLNTDSVLLYTIATWILVDGNPYDIDRGRGCPQASRSVCATHHGIKFVNVNQHGGGSSSSSSSSRSFSITLWSWREEDQTWGEDATLDADQLRDLDSENRLPNIQPEFPVVDMENPYAVCFLLNERYHTADPNATTWMIKVHMKKKVLLDCTGYSNKGSPSTARRMSEGLSFISSEMPSYLSRKTIKRQEVDKLGI